MTATWEVIGVCFAGLGVMGGFFAYAIHISNRLVLTESAATKALAATETHTVQIALTKNDASTALKLSAEHTKELADSGAKVAGMESTYHDIRDKLSQLDGIRQDIGQLKTDVGVLKSQVSDTRTDVQDCVTGLNTLNRTRRAASSKKRKR